MTDTSPASNDDHVALTEHYSAHNYHPLPVVITHAEGVWVVDADGKRYMDMLAAYSALNFGHRNAELVNVAKAQLDRVTLTSRAFFNDQLGPFCRDLADLCGMEMVLPMNTGAEAVETALKTARKWGYQTKKIPADRAKIITCQNNFHGRTITIVSFSTDPQARAEFGPYTSGFVTVPYGDLAALQAAIDPDTVAFLVEPIQGEAGIIVPPADYLQSARELCRQRGVLFIVDEIQSGLGRTGATFTCDLYGVKPDMFIIGKAIAGGIVPLSAVVASRAILGVFKPGEHGSTFGGNPLACAIGRKVIEILKTGHYQRNSAELGRYLIDTLRGAQLPAVNDIRGRGLWVGIEIKKEAGVARTYCERLMGEGLLCKDTHEQTMRLAPPLSINKSEIDWAIARLLRVLR